MSISRRNNNENKKNGNNKMCHACFCKRKISLTCSHWMFLSLTTLFHINIYEELSVSNYVTESNPVVIITSSPFWRYLVENILELLFFHCIGLFCPFCLSHSSTDSKLPNSHHIFFHSKQNWATHFSHRKKNIYDETSVQQEPIQHRK